MHTLTFIKRFSHFVYFNFQYPPTSIDSFLTCDDVDLCLEYLKHNDNYDMAVGVSRLHAMSTSFYGNREIFCFDQSQNIANYTISLAIFNHNELIAIINKIIRHALEGGLFVKWQRENRINVLQEAGAERQPEQLGIDESLIVLYFIGLPGLFLATATLLLERLIASQKLQAKTAEKRIFWSRLENLVDGRRHFFKLKGK